MASGKKVNLDDLLRKDIPQGPIRRGSGFHLSTEEVASEPPPVEQQSSHNRTIAPIEEVKDMPKRVNRGYKLREDLIKQCKRVALEEDRTLYDVMEEAIESYLERRVSPDRDKH